jgi:hypothetical protein
MGANQADSVATIGYGPEGKTEHDSRVFRDRVAMGLEADPKLLLSVPDTADAAIRSRARSNLLRSRLDGAGRAGSFLNWNPLAMNGNSR